MKKPIFVSGKWARKKNTPHKLPHNYPACTSTIFRAHPMPPLLYPPIDQEQEASPVAIDREWTASLVGLRMRVAAGFVPGRKGRKSILPEKLSTLMLMMISTLSPCRNKAHTILIDKEYGLDSAEEWPTGTARCTSSLHQRQ